MNVTQETNQSINNVGIHTIHLTYKRLKKLFSFTLRFLANDNYFNV